MKKIVRLYTGPDGESHFEDIELPIDDKLSEIDEHTVPFKTKEMTFRESIHEVGKGDHIGWHNAPRRLLYIMLGGTLELEVGDGTKRLFKAGDVFIAEDMTGRGHLSRARNRRAALIELD